MRSTVVRPARKKGQPGAVVTGEELAANVNPDVVTDPCQQLQAPACMPCRGVLRDGECAKASLPRMPRQQVLDVSNGERTVIGQRLIFSKLSTIRTLKRN